MCKATNSSLNHLSHSSHKKYPMSEYGVQDHLPIMTMHLILVNQSLVIPFHCLRVYTADGWVFRIEESALPILKKKFEKISLSAYLSAYWHLLVLKCVSYFKYRGNVGSVTVSTFQAGGVRWLLWLWLQSLPGIALNRS